MTLRTLTRKPAFRRLVNQWLWQEISEAAFCIAAARLLDCTEGEVRDMIDNFEV